jgi:hypothetical protein
MTTPDTKQKSENNELFEHKDELKSKSKVHVGTKTGLKDLGEMKKHMFNWPDIPNKLNEGLYSFTYKNFEYDFLYRPSKEKRLFVLLSGYADRAKFDPPVFQRWTWSRYFPGHCLYISDPTLKLHKDLGLAWYVGTREEEILPIIVQIIKNVAIKLDIPLRNVIVYASSGGAFAALHLSALIPEVITVAINPQIDITQYRNGTVKRFLCRCFDGINPGDAILEYPNRLSIIPICTKLLNNRVIYVQNKLDTHHYEDHFKVFAKEIGLNDSNNYKVKKIEAILFEHPGSHAKAETPEVFQAIMEKILLMTETDTVHSDCLYTEGDIRLKVNSKCTKAYSNTEIDITDKLIKTECLQDCSDQVSKLQSELEKVAEELNTQRELEKDLLKQLKEREVLLKKIKEDYNNVLKEKNRIMRQYDKIAQCRTWQCTLPLRKLADMIKRFTRS